MIAVLSGVFGAVIGSFLNVVIYRVPRGLSVVHPPSACPGCGSAIAAYDNVPVLSWLILRGKCRNCAQPISIRYPLVESGTAILFVLAALRFIPGLLGADDAAQTVGGFLVLLAFLWLAGCSVALAMIDLDVHRLPNAIVFPLFLAGAVLLTSAGLIADDGGPLLRAVAGAAILGGVYLLLALVVPGGMGMGDVKLAAALGLFLGYLGWGELAVGGIGAFLLGGVFGMLLLLTRRAGRRTAVPFGPWMLLAAWIGILAGEPLASAYLQLTGLES